MTREELLSVLDIDNGSDFQYVENMADLVESEEEITEDALAAVLAEGEGETFIEVSEGYFGDLMDHLPDEAAEAYTVIEAIRNNFRTLAGQMKEDPTSLTRLCEEIVRFRAWFTEPDTVTCTDEDTGDAHTESIMDAVADHRLSVLDGNNWTFDFGNIGDYPIDDYIVNLGDLQYVD